MKKNYSKPNMKMVQLLSAEQLMAASGQKFGIYDQMVDGSQALSNKESMDIWGHSGNNIWE